MEFGIGNAECGRLKLGDGEAMKLGSKKANTEYRMSKEGILSII
jgi:hypothetical protein